MSGAYREVGDGPIGTVTFMNETQTVAIVFDPALAEAIRALPEVTALLWHLENNLRTYQDDIRRCMNANGLATEYGEVLDPGMADVVDDAERFRADIRKLYGRLGGQP